MELDDDVSLGGGRKLLVEGKSCTLIFLIVRDVGGLDGLLGLGVFGCDRGFVDLQLMGVEHDFLGGLADLGGDGDGALVAESTAKLEVIQRNGIVGGLDAVRRLEHGGSGIGGRWRASTHVSGRTSLSEAMFAWIHESVLQGRDREWSGGSPCTSLGRLGRGRGLLLRREGCERVCKLVLSRRCPAKLEAGEWNTAI